jgi:hypothetical protein
MRKFDAIDWPLAVKLTAMANEAGIEAVAHVRVPIAATERPG